jgi:hypothetical protein
LPKKKLKFPAFRAVYQEMASNKRKYNTMMVNVIDDDMSLIYSCQNKHCDCGESFSVYYFLNIQ